MAPVSKIISNTVPLCFMPNGSLVCYQHGDLIVLNDGFELKRFHIIRTMKEHYLGYLKLLTRCLRLGVRSAVPINDSIVVFSIGNMLHEFNIETGVLSRGFFCGAGVRPLIFTNVENVAGFEKGLYFGAYISDFRKIPVDVYRRLNEDKWEVVYSFPEGTINHIHNIVADPYRNCLWIFTGDFGDAAAIWKVTENFKKVERIASNDQKYRACVAFVLPEGLLYATDAPFADDYIYLLNPESMELKELFPIDGSCIYGCKWKEKFVFSSTVEGDGRNTPKMEFLFGRKRGAGIKDDCVHMYMGDPGEGFTEIYKEKKDCMPYYTFQFGVFKYPVGVNNSDTLYFQPVATRKHDLDLMTLSL